MMVFYRSVEKDPQKQTRNGNKMCWSQLLQSFISRRKMNIGDKD